MIINLMGNCGFTRREASSSRSTCCIHNEGELGLLEEKEVRASNHCHESEVVISTQELKQMLSCNKEGKKASIGNIGVTWKSHLATIDEIEEHQ